MKPHFLLLAVIFPFLPITASAQTPVVVELYTSQSCSSCPKADALLEKLSAEPDIITIGCHVDYWNHLDWKDSFSLFDCTQRQRDFGQRLEAGRVYTPEAIINGRSQMVGYREDLLRSAIRKQKTDAKVKELGFTKSGDILSVNFPELPTGQRIPYIVTLMSYGDSKEVTIGSGENGGRKVTYVKPVLAIKKLNMWNGAAETRNLPVFASDEGIKGLVVTVQAEAGGPIIAAGELKL